MISRLTRHASQHVVAYLALFVALGGTSFAAAVSLPSNSVGPTQVKANAITSAKVKNGSLQRVDFAAGQLPSGPQGPAGPAGAAGAQGAPGTALAYAHVNADGSIDSGRSKNVAGTMVGHPSAGVYCLHDLPFAPHNVTATVGTSGSGWIVVADVGTAGSTCPAGTQVTAIVFDAPGGYTVNNDLWVQLN